MKLYIVHYNTIEGGQMRAFSSRAKAQKDINNVKREMENREMENEDYYYSQVFTNIPVEADFSPTRQGLIDALQYGADLVCK